MSSDLALSKFVSDFRQRSSTTVSNGVATAHAVADPLGGPQPDHGFVRGESTLAWTDACPFVSTARNQPPSPARVSHPDAARGPFEGSHINRLWNLDLEIPLNHPPLAGNSDYYIDYYGNMDSYEHHMWSSRRLGWGWPTPPKRPLPKDTVDLFAALIFSLYIAPAEQLRRTSTHSYTAGRTKAMSQDFIDAGLVRKAGSLYELTSERLRILEDFISQNGNDTNRNPLYPAPREDTSPDAFPHHSKPAKSTPLHDFAERDRESGASFQHKRSRRPESSHKLASDYEPNPGGWGEEPVVIAAMGSTGAGQSSFVNSALGSPYCLVKNHDASGGPQQIQTDTVSASPWQLNHLGYTFAAGRRDTPSIVENPPPATRAAKSRCRTKRARLIERIQEHSLEIGRVMEAFRGIPPLVLSPEKVTRILSPEADPDLADSTLARHLGPAFADLLWLPSERPSGGTGRTLLHPHQEVHTCRPIPVWDIRLQNPPPMATPWRNCAEVDLPLNLEPGVGHGVPPYLEHGECLYEPLTIQGVVLNPEEKQANDDDLRWERDAC